MEEDPSKARAASFAKLREIFFAGLEAVDPSAAVARAVQRRGRRILVRGKSYCLDDYRRIYVVGAGKAAAPMALAMERILGERLSGGLVVVKYGYLPHTGPREVEIVEAGHPIPDEAGRRGAERIEAVARCATEGDLVVCLFSGGASALLPLPAVGIGLEDKQEVTERLLACGASIAEINAVRKHLSRMKGGQLARLASPASVVSLILSDVVGDPLDVIASGPTAPDRTTFADCLRILGEYGLEQRLPPAVMAHLRAGAAGTVEETPKEGDPVFARVHNCVIANNLRALEAAQRKARAMGYRTLLLSSQIEGESREVAAVLSAIFKEAAASGHPLRPPACILSGGETTVTVRGKGRGGRNQELALWVATRIQGSPRISFLSAGTDGTDGPTEAAGAFVDGLTVELAAAAGMRPQDYLQENNSYVFFERLGDLFVTGPTNTNVMDLMIAIIA